MQYLTPRDSYSLLVYLVSPRGMAWLVSGLRVIRSVMAKRVLSERRYHRRHRISARVCRSLPVIMANACLSTATAMAVTTAATKVMNPSVAQVSDRQACHPCHPCPLSPPPTCIAFLSNISKFTHFRTHSSLTLRLWYKPMLTNNKKEREPSETNYSIDVCLISFSVRMPNNIS